MYGKPESAILPVLFQYICIVYLGLDECQKGPGKTDPVNVSALKKLPLLMPTRKKLLQETAMGQLYVQLHWKKGGRIL